MRTLDEIIKQSAEPGYVALDALTEAGYVIVPKEPTTAMIKAGGDAVYAECGTGTAIDDRQAKAAWAAMIAKA